MGTAVALRPEWHHLPQYAFEARQSHPPTSQAGQLLESNRLAGSWFLQSLHPTIFAYLVVESAPEQPQFWTDARD
jgi:hypothetical protein